jgi:outer membrane lipoprotein-sorting protein
MNDRNHDQPDELLDRATEALRNAPVPARPPAGLVRATIERLTTQTASPELLQLDEVKVRLAERKAKMIRIARYSTALAAGLLIAIGIGSLALMNQTTSAAFAGVLENVRQADSVTFTNKQKIGIGPAMEVKGYLQREHFRWELPGVLAIIADFKEKSVIELNLVAKTATGRPFPKGDNHPFANPIQAIERAKPEDAKLVRTETLEGNTVDVYEVDKIDFMGSHGDGTTTVWVDRKTRLPMRIVLDDPSEKPGASVRLAFEGFEWNRQLDEQLFKIPEDFTFKGLIDNTPPTTDKE